MKAFCSHCHYLDLNGLNNQYEQVEEGEHFCGLHGRSRVDPNGEQQQFNRTHDDEENLGHDITRYCGYYPKERYEQLSLFG